MAGRWLIAGVLLAGCSGSGSSAESECPVGDEGCECTPSGNCSPGLECIDMVCEDPNAGSGGSGTGGSDATRDDGSGATGGGGSGGTDSTGGAGGSTGGTSTTGSGGVTDGTSDAGTSDAGTDTQGTATSGTSDGGSSDTSGASTSGTPSDSATTGSSTTMGGNPNCGNGQLDGSELCDDGINDGSYGSCTSNCLGFGPRCGDGVVNGPEDCDDTSDDCDQCMLDAAIDWTATADGEGMNDGAHGVAIDGAGNVFVAGYVQTAASGVDILLLKLDAAGDEVWRRTHAETGTYADYGNAVAVDSSGNVFVAGHVGVGSSDTDIWIRKYDDDGTVVWTDSHSSDDMYDRDVAYGVAVDSQGRIAVGGTWDRRGWLRQYDNGGVEQWTILLSAHACVQVQTKHEVHGVAINSNDDVIAAGFGSDCPDVNQTRLLAWTVGSDGMSSDLILAPSAYGYSKFRGTAVAPGDAPVLIGHSGQSNPNIVARMYDVNDVQLWTKTIQGDADEADYGYGAAASASDRIFVIGQIVGTDGVPRIWIRRYDDAGNDTWTRASSRGTGRDVEIAGDALFAAGVHDDGGQTDVWVRKYAISP